MVVVKDWFEVHHHVMMVLVALKESAFNIVYKIKQIMTDNYSIAPTQDIILIIAQLGCLNDINKDLTCRHANNNECSI